MTLVACCPECGWEQNAGADVNSMLQACAALDAHMVSIHNYSLGEATSLAQEWLQHSAQRLARPKRSRTG